ncbi:amino acid/amide ABC transporter membrane protein 1 (HAAT family) [Tepidamorphus gemmatus]|jgi:branched-chain amino acid transport system permease protein|uniref:Amino acid/amide ABC transporter membrane protein 1 (HAAT family) n=1 Tax=Tepidamorphus gemmatus TaxID=747076 RepID=A0A4V2UZJ2_9HYPH|nr:branched-chain amino acid ABC transporter permease [Tepidamorphus gemmatus]TCT11548.1 amino acid/amide ABC transporter membrane protein 1 (HAAT family) [Tepidamorphus gemmatus]
MDYVVLMQQITNGLVNGMTYVLIATGLTLVFGVLHIINFAHGEFYMLGAFFTFFAAQLLGLDYISAAIVATIGVAVLGILANRLFFWPLRREHEFTVLLSSLGLALLLTNGGELIFGADPKYIPSPFADEVVEIGQVVMTQQRALIFAVGAVVLVLLYLFIRHTSMGRMMRATAQNPEGAALTGVNIRNVYTVTFILACGLAALAGALVGPTSMIFPTVGSWAVLKGFIVVILGGLGSIPGALIGGLALGVVESLAGGYISLGFAQAIGYAIIIVVLLWRPQGLFGHARRV